MKIPASQRPHAIAISVKSPRGHIKKKIMSDLASVFKQCVHSKIEAPAKPKTTTLDPSPKKDLESFQLKI